MSQKYTDMVMFPFYIKNQLPIHLVAMEEEAELQA